MTQAGEHNEHACCALSDGTELSLTVRPKGSRELTPPVRAQPLLDALAPLAEARLKNARTAGKARVDAPYGLVGQSAGMIALVRMIDKVAGSQASVLITGENGTGKELVARAIHVASARRDRPFIAVNCSAFNDNLLESEMFGHRRGAFTGAQVDKRGLFEEADGGTLFLDEVGDMSPALQVKLLRVLQEGTFLAVGATQQKKVDVRIVAATNRELVALLKQGKFREDLYYRLHVVALRVPALRDRGEDIAELSHAFLERLNQRHGKGKALHAHTLEKLRAHRFPGNVRELSNELERMFVLSGDELVIGPEHLSASIAGALPPTGADKPDSSDRSADPGEQDTPLQAQLERFERDVLERTLRRVRGNRTRAAELLGVSRRNLLRKLQQHGLGGDEEGALD